MKRLGFFLFFLLLLFAIGKAWHWSKDGFQVQRIWKLNSVPSSTPIKPEVMQALDQPFSYLGKGRQCYVLVSQDDNYVLKLPRFDRYVVSLEKKALSPKKEAHFQDKEHRKRFYLESLSIADRELKEETALIYVHFEPTKGLRSDFVFKDPLKRTILLDLNRTAFFLQKKTKLWIDLFRQALDQGKKEEAQAILTSFLDLIAKRASLGIWNKDPTFLTNFGYDNKIVQIDVGSFYRKTGEKGASFDQTVAHVQKWLEGIDREMGAWFEKTCQEKRPL